MEKRYGFPTYLRKSLGTTLVVPFIASSPVTYAQSGEQMAIEEVVVTARRKGENLQDVPVTVNVIDSSKLNNLNIRKLEDIETVVPGLSLEEDTILPNASMRGVQFHADAATTGSVAFYLNDAPVPPQTVVQSVFDVGQVEVLRGPQGTARGVSAPSGSISITTARPNLEEIDGFIDLTTTSEGGRNANGAISLPIIEDKLGARFSAFHEENEGSGVRSINDGESDVETDAYRFSLRYEPLDTLSANIMYQKLYTDRLNFEQVESANRADPSKPAPREGDIAPEDRKAVADAGEDASQEYQNTVAQIAWDFAENYRLDYVGAYSKLEIERFDPADDGNALNSDSCPACSSEAQTHGQNLETEATFQSHEFRLTRSFERVEATLGALYSKQESENELSIGALTTLPATFGGATIVAQVPVTGEGEAIEKSVFGSATIQLSDATEMVLGLRKLSYEDEGVTVFIGTPIPDELDEDKVLYMASLKHRFNDQWMAYVTAGSAFRPGADVTIGRQSSTTSAREQSFLVTDAEESDSIEFGFKSDLMDSRLRLNGSLYYQEFDNYAFKPGEDTYYIANSGQLSENVTTHRYVSAVPVNVFGFELDATYQATPNWMVNGTYSWSEGRIDDGTVPCNDYAPADGEPDGAGNSAPTAAQIRASSGGDNVSACEVDHRANNAPLWNASLLSQYDFSWLGMDSYVRGLATVYGNSKGDPTNQYDDLDRYALLNLYLGFKDPEGAWEVMFFGKNITETEEVTRRNANLPSVNSTNLGPTFTPTGSTTYTSTYRLIGMTPPREFGVNFRYRF